VVLVEFGVVVSVRQSSDVGGGWWWCNVVVVRVDLLVAAAGGCCGVCACRVVVNIVVCGVG
jgi:hypothetical protein